MSGPVVSVILPAFNAGGTLRETIDSVLSQTYSQLELVVINDGSTDDTEAIAHSYAARNGEGVVVISQENRGLSATRNVGIRRSRGELLAFIDADDVWLPHKTARQLEALSLHRNAALVTCNYAEIDADGVVFGESDEKTAFEATGTTVAGQAIRVLSSFQTLLFGNTVGPPSGVMVRRDHLEQAGCFDEELVNGAEDWNLYLKMARLAEVLHVDDCLLHYRVLPDSMSSARNAERMLANEIKVLDGVFAAPELGKRTLLRRRAYARRYERAALALSEAGRRRETFMALATAVFRYPPILFEPSCAHHAVRAALGRDRFERLRAVLRRAPRR